MWDIQHLSGDAATFHARPVPDDIGPTVWTFAVEQPALVLGSAQPDTHVDVDACATAGVEVVRRRSGGGAVLVVPDEIVWVDVIVPRDHDRWDDDVVRSAFWLGDAWAAALTDLGRTDLSVHHGGLVNSTWSRHVCFAGTGPGEVVAGEGGKLVGISQRRTRHHARFQCAVHRRWQPDLMVTLLASPRPGVDDIATAAAVVDHPCDQIVAALVAAL